jgi:hypothetical protein
MGLDEVKALIPETVNVWKNYKKRMPSRSSAGVTKPSRSAQGTSNVYSQFSGLPDPVASETEEQRLEREQNERDVFEALGDYKCDRGISVENVPAVVNVQTLKERLIAQVLYWVGGGCGEECENEEECCWQKIKRC